MFFGEVTNIQEYYEEFKESLMEDFVHQGMTEYFAEKAV